MTVEELGQIPPLGGSFVRGASGSGVAAARRVLPGSDAPQTTTLPDTTLRVAEVSTSGDDVARRLAEYERLVGERPSETMPAGFLHVLGFPLATALMVRPEFPLPLLGMVHVENHVSLFRPVELGESVTVTARAEGLRGHRRGTQVDLVTDVTVVGDDSPAYTGVSTYLAKGVHIAPAPEETERPEFVPPLPTARWRLDARVGKAYATVSGDRNPIHVSVLGAKAFGFPRTIAHGMYTAARALAQVGPARGDAYDWDVQFARPVVLPGVVDVSVRPGTDGVWSITGWNARKRLLHLNGSVTPR
ncbi:MaoC family dehydratase [Paraoerskovia marina]|uniref:MaoC family dehydratase n=1 Tax=Paraoerskovia marina TaxID=545619 RepID=UPI000492262C|nr:MaoC/PaaZ C-terminal domain-containing protein [Paraoerskovia marina]